MYYTRKLTVFNEHHYEQFEGVTCESVITKSFYLISHVAAGFIKLDMRINIHHFAQTKN